MPILHEHTATNLHPVMFCSIYSLINIFTLIPTKYSSDEYYFIKTQASITMQIASLLSVNDLYVAVNCIMCEVNSKLCVKCGQ